MLAGAVAQIPDNGSKTRLPWQFLQQAYDDGLKGHYDAISWHVYAYQANDRVEGFGAGSAFARDWEEMRRVVRRNDPGKQFWITETGVTRLGKGTSISTAEHTKRLSELVKRELEMPDVEGGVRPHALRLGDLPRRGAASGASA